LKRLLVGLGSFRAPERIAAIHPTRPSARVVVNGSLGLVRKQTNRALVWLSSVKVEDSG